MDLDKAIEKRHCTRKFKRTKKVSFKDIGEILDSARYAPMAGGIHTLMLVVVDNEKLKAKLADAALGQSFIADAPYIIVVCSDMAQISKSYGKRAEMYARQQAGAAVENMFLKITDLKLATCWIGAFDENAVKRVLRIPNKVNVEAILPVGYSFEKELMKEKIDLKRIVRFNDWETKWTTGVWPIEPGE
jgi:nitroreductase